MSGLIVLGLIYVTCIVVCFMKGKAGFGWLGIAAVIAPIAPLVAWFPIIGTIRLAKPDSSWAIKNYGPDEMARAMARFPGDRRRHTS